MHFKRLSLLSIALVFLAAFALAQADVATFLGTVYDPDGLALPGVTVTATNQLTGLTRSTVSNESGQYRLERLPRGDYTLTATLPGFKTLEKTDLPLIAGDELRIDFTLEIGTIEEEVTVIGESPLVETTRSQVSTVFTEKEFLSYPQGNRNYLTLMAYAPGTLPGAGRSGYAINGMRGSSNNFMIDGISNNDEGLQGAGTTALPLEAIQEFRLISNNFSAEYGRNSGGYVNTVMKSGTNELHGSAFVFHRGDSAFFRSIDWVTGERAPYDRWQYGGTIGGPIIKDKTFFFLTFEGTNLKEEDTTPLWFYTQEAVASATGYQRQAFDMLDYPTPTYDFRDLDGDGRNDIGRYVWDGTSKDKVYNFGAKIDHIFSENDRIAIRWLHQRYDLERTYATVPGETKFPTFRYNTGGITWLHLFSPTMYNEVRLGYHSDHRSWPRIVADLPRNYIPTVQNVGDAGNMPQDFKNETFQIVDVLNFQLGNHSVKVGGEMRYWRSDSVFDAYVFGYYVWFTTMSFINGQQPWYMIGGADPPDPEPGNPYVPGDPTQPWGRGDTHRKWRGIEWGIFAQDDWRVSDRFTLSFGLRWEYFGVPTETSGVGINMPAFGTQAGFESMQIIEGEYNEEGIRYLMFDGRELLGKGLWDPYYGGFAPKVSFAYDLTGDGKTSLRGGFGVAYDRTFNNTYENDRFNYPDFTFATFLGGPYGFPAITPTIPVSIPQANVSNYRAALRWMDPKLTPQQALNWMLGIQREVAPNFLIEANYTGSKGRRLGVIQRPNRYTGDLLDGSLDGINPYGAPGDVNVREQYYESNYHAGTIVFNKRFSKGWSWYTAYTFGWAEDQNSDYFGDNTGYFAVSHERKQDEWGYAQFDRRHRLVGGFVWEIPFGREHENWFVKNILAGWQISGNFHWTSAAPFTVQSTTGTHDYNFDGGNKDRPVWLGGSNDDVIHWDAGEPSLSPDDFARPEPPSGPRDMSYYDQNFTTRNQFRWYPTHNIDIALQKYFTIPAGARDLTLQFILEVFNVMNSKFWNFPNRSFHSSAFGTVSRMGDGFFDPNPRTAQISVRVLF